MALSLYDAIVPQYLQILGAADAFMTKGRQHCEDNDIDLDSVVQHRLTDDMLPFHFQAVCMSHHSLGALNGVREGVFTPPPALELDYAGLHALVQEAKHGIEALSADDVNALEGNDVTFKLGDMAIPFTAVGFLTSFSLPNFHFHATTAYDILRVVGVPLGKRDYLGAMAVKAG